MRPRLPLLLSLLVLVALVAAVPAATAAPDLRGKKKTTCSLKRKAKCKKAKIKGVKIGRQNLSGSNLSGATITGATFTGTNMSNVDLSKATLRNVTFKNVNLGGASLKGATLINVTMDHVDASKGNSARVNWCTMSIESDQETFCSKPGLDADGLTVRGGQIAWADFPNSLWRKATFINTTFVVPTFTGARFDDAKFQEGSAIVGLTLTGAHDPKPAYAYAMISRARFDGSSGLFLRLATGDDPSFLGATRLTIKDSTLTRPRGLDGGRAITVAAAAGTSIVPDSIQIKETGYWRIGNLCLKAATCSYTAAVGMPVEINITSASDIDVTAPGLTCAKTGSAGAFTVSCAAKELAAGAALAVTYGAAASAAPPTKKVTVNIDITASRIAIQTVTAAGSIIATKECLAATTCEASVAVGSWVVVAFTVADPGGAPPLVVDIDGTITDTSLPLPVSDSGTAPFEVKNDTVVTAHVSVG